MARITRRQFLAVLAALSAAGLAGCSARSANPLLTDPVVQSESIAVNRSDAASIAEAETDVAFTDLTEPTLQLMTGHVFNSSGWNEAILEYLAAYPGAPGEMALTVYHFGAQNGGPYPEYPTATAMTAQQAANQGALLMRFLRPNETAAWQQVYTLCERQDDTGTRHQLWQVILVRAEPTDAQGAATQKFSWSHLYLDAVTGALFGYYQSAAHSGKAPQTAQEQQNTLSRLQQTLESALEAAGAGQTLSELCIDSDRIDSLDLAFCYTAFVDGRFYEIYCERDGSLVRFWPADEA